MRKNQLNKSAKRKYLVAGILLSFAIIGVGGCGTPAASATPQNQKQNGQRAAQNPAQKAAMEINRLQKDPQYVLTSDQKTKIKPILQDLISTSDPSAEILQQKADAINAVLTDPQKTFLATPRTTTGNNQNTNGSKGYPSNGNSAQAPQGGTNGKQAGSAPSSQNMYQQVLDSLT